MIAPRMRFRSMKSNDQILGEHIEISAPRLTAGEKTRRVF